MRKIGEISPKIAVLSCRALLKRANLQIVQMAGYARPTVYTRHVNFVDAANFGLGQPFWFSIIQVSVWRKIMINPFLPDCKTSFSQIFFIFLCYFNIFKT